ncbi:hypothetical protein PQO03_17750 [Lentisphaera profundi]|uniref:Uncharacterized protein n=1 Tax=Lentisphaera profundi TaxID=1658616 RepID=A0ABY7VVD2_9BACT|nr:hypothetical protein [Lentisphaera profundi]WDE97672.1 hypothetical protein PQO03_17750 [Lentisphaera profundi]
MKSSIILALVASGSVISTVLVKDLTYRSEILPFSALEKETQVREKMLSQAEPSDSFFESENPFDPLRGTQLEQVEEISQEEVQEVVEPQHPYNFVLRGIMGVENKKTVILHYDSPQSASPKAHPSSRKGRSPQTKTKDQVFALEDDVGETGYSVVEINSEEVILVNNSGNEIVLTIDESNSVSVNMRKQVQKYAEQENKVILAQAKKRQAELKNTPKVSVQEKTTKGEVKPDAKTPSTTELPKTKEELYKEQRIERIKKLKQLQKSRKKERTNENL